MDAALRGQLACPRCKGALTDDEARGELVCPRCGLAYPVRDDVPIMLVDEARPVT